MSPLRILITSAALVPVFVLTSCALLPSAQPTSKVDRVVTGEPSPEIVKAADSLVAGYLDAYSRGLNANHYTADDFEPFITGELLEGAEADDGLLLPEGYHATGTIVSAGFDPESWDSETGTLRGFACEDRSDLRIFDATGANVTDPARPSRFESDITITGLPDNPRISAYTPYLELDAC